MTDAEPSRIAFLRDRVQTARRDPDHTTFDVPFRQRHSSLVKILVPIAFPLYNIKSGRTHKAQTEWIDRNGGRSDFFDDPEDGEVQGVQHSLLLQMIQEAGLDADLARRRQRNPIVLTHDGYIIDGNRRVAALRDAGDVENAEAVVLPEDATRAELFETELELQMAKETRADYDWIDQGLHVRYGVRELREPISSVAQRMNKPEQEIDDILARMVLVDLYLAWVGNPDAYHRVPDDSEQAFIELGQIEGSQKHKNLSTEHREAIRLACFGVIQSAVGGYMDIRNVANTIRNDPAGVTTRLREHLPEALITRLDAPISPTNDHPHEDDVLFQLAEAAGDEIVTPGIEIINVFQEPGDAIVAAPPLIDIAKEIVEEGKEVRAHLQPLRKLDRALNLVRSIQITNETQQLGNVAQRLRDLNTETDRIATELGDHIPPDA